MQSLALASHDGLKFELLTAQVSSVPEAKISMVSENRKASDVATSILRELGVDEAEKQKTETSGLDPSIWDEEDASSKKESDEKLRQNRSRNSRIPSALCANRLCVSDTWP